MKKKDIVIILLFLVYAVLGSSYVFFPDCELNKVLSAKSVFAHIYSFSTLIGFVVIVFSILEIFIPIFRNGFQFRIDAANLVLILTVALSLLFILFGTDNKKPEGQSADKRTIKLVEWNAADNINEKNIQDIFGRFDADIAVFPELGGYEIGDMTNRKLAALFKKAEIDFEEYEAHISVPQEIYGYIAPVTVVIKKSFGYYNVFKDTPVTTYGTLYLSSSSANNPDIIGLHTAPPLFGLMNLWRWDLDLIEDISNENQDAIIIGDFNATMRHGSLNNIESHVDVLEYAPKFSSGTWNTNIPSVFRTRIDHILIPKDKYSVNNVEIKKYPNSDHLCVFTELQENSITP